MTQPEVNLFETTEEELQPSQEEGTEIILDVPVVEEPVIEESKPIEPERSIKVRAPLSLSPPPKRHPRNTPRFSKPHSGT